MSGVTIHLATSLTTITIADGIDGSTTDYDVPDIGQLRTVLRPLGEIWVGAIYDQENSLVGAITLQDVNSINITGTPYRLYSGQVGSQEIFDNVLSSLGADRVKTGLQAESGVFRGRLESAVARLRRKSNGEDSGFVAQTCIAGEDRVITTLEPGEVPEDFDVIEP